MHINVLYLRTADPIIESLILFCRLLMTFDVTYFMLYIFFNFSAFC